MANAHTTKDRLDEAIQKSLVTFFEADLVAAWGSAVEIVAGSPDFDYENRILASGATEARDLSVKPLLVIIPLGGVGRPWAISPQGDEMERSVRLRLNMAAGAHWDILSLKGTVEAVLDGAGDGTGALSVKDPDDQGSELGVVYFDDQIQLSNLFGGPGENALETASLPEGKGQFGTLKHRASLVFGINIRKPRGSAVL